MYVEDGVFYGAKAKMNVWKPNVEMPNEFSLAQIWVLGGNFNSDLNSIEAGWQVFWFFLVSCNFCPEKETTFDSNICVSGQSTIVW